MVANDLEAKYQRAMDRLSELVQQRDRFLLQLDTLVSLPLSVNPRSGHVAEFDLDAARELVEDLAGQTAQIGHAMDAVNEIARQMQRTTVVWLKMPRSKSELDGNEP